MMKDDKETQLTQDRRALTRKKR